VDTERLLAAFDARGPAKSRGYAAPRSASDGSRAATLAGRPDGGTHTVKKAHSRKRARRALGAALAGILAGSTLALGCGQSSDASPSEANGCNGPNGCGGEQEAAPAGGAHAEANGCNGPNGCGGEAQ
jgi:hypothetical protein